MLKLQHNESPDENQDSNLNKLRVYEELEEEQELLLQEQNALTEAEKQLWLRINDAIENKKQTNKEMKQEVERLRRKCEGLAAVLNRGNLSPALSQQLNKDIEKLETHNKTAMEAISKLLIRKNDLEARSKELV
jgi:hypothetical protein